MGDRKRDEHGRYNPEHSEAEIIDAVRKHEPAGTQEVADELGIARQSADYRLRQLVDVGNISKKKVGRSLVWTVSENKK